MTGTFEWQLVIRKSNLIGGKHGSDKILKRWISDVGQDISFLKHLQEGNAVGYRWKQQGQNQNLGQLLLPLMNHFKVTLANHFKKSSTSFSITFFLTSSLILLLAFFFLFSTSSNTKHCPLQVDPLNRLTTCVFHLRVAARDHLDFIAPRGMTIVCVWGGLWSLNNSSWISMLRTKLDFFEEFCVG